ncbi:thymidylate synthase [Colobine gammaherpesvirus 1]|uniref:Thymidylate synthase n=1 Tax=Colobine gammaherpesvirus 1 TaxID=2597325 RepID=A0A5B8G5B3_9GAMA|nr:thymidylate synthase [Colobine gammaherpesvirus 1]QDQ69220.1 thymidylate synthase [Colobine gammaherpesvirus 1]
MPDGASDTQSQSVTTGGVETPDPYLDERWARRQRRRRHPCLRLQPEMLRAVPPGADVDINPGERQYLQQLCHILDSGRERPDRTGVGTLSVFGLQARYSLRGEFPLLTTKRVYWKGVVEELLWFLKGDTDSKRLSERGVKIWDANSSLEFLASRGLGHRREGDLGPVYGFQWRHFGATYVDADTDYAGQGVDQLARIIDLIKTSPHDRRMVMSAWNPVDMPLMALPPCHVLCQFYVADGEISCQLYQRSADMGLGVPFNIASYALLTYMVAHVTRLKPGDFIHTMGDAHIYKNHVDAIKVQLRREPRPFPRLRIARVVNSIDDFVSGDFELDGYFPHPVIPMKLAV